jgi:hypothetical protein
MHVMVSQIPGEQNLFISFELPDAVMRGLPWAQVNQGKGEAIKGYTLAVTPGLIGENTLFFDSRLNMNLPECLATQSDV